VGTIAAGVAKGHADLIHLSGYNGGTGASPLSSIKNAGAPWEVGLAETQQTLLVNGLRGRVRVRVDGGFKTGRDVVVAALLGADEFSFGTAALVAAGCKMARACHNNTCPVGIATQREDLRAKFPGKPEMVMHFMTQVAAEVRELLANLGAATLDEIIGHTELLHQVIVGADAGNMDLAPLLWAPDTGNVRRNVDPRNPLLRTSPLGDRLAADAMTRLAVAGSRLHARSFQPSTFNLQPVTLSYPICNTDRTVGARLSGEIARHYGDTGLPDGSIVVDLHGSAGQSFGAFAIRGLTLRLTGQANDYVGKGLAGAVISIRPPAAAQYVWHHNVILGNTALYGATAGELYAAGRAGERFAVRNSGARAVVEGVGDHGCLRVHDRRRGRRAGPDGPQLRRGHDRRSRVSLRQPRADARTCEHAACQPAPRRASRARGRAPGPAGTPPRADRQPARPHDPGRLDAAPPALLARCTRRAGRRAGSCKRRSDRGGRRGTGDKVTG